MILQTERELQKKYEKLSEEKTYQSDIATKLKDDSYAAKYARAKYSFSKEGVHLYGTRLVTTIIMENVLQKIEQFLSFSDEKLTELSEKNQALKLQEKTKERGGHA